MKIVRDIIEEVIKLVENDKLKCSFNSSENEGKLFFSKNELRISTFYIKDKNVWYFQIYIVNPAINNKIIVSNDNEPLFSRTKFLYDLIKNKYYDSDPELKSILDDLKSGKIEVESVQSEESLDNDSSFDTNEFIDEDDDLIF